MAKDTDTTEPTVAAEGPLTRAEGGKVKPLDADGRALMALSRGGGGRAMCDCLKKSKTGAKHLKALAALVDDKGVPKDVKTFRSDFRTILDAIAQEGRAAADKAVID